MLRNYRDLRRAQKAERRYRTTGDRAALEEAAAAWDRILNDPGFARSTRRFQIEVLNDAAAVFFLRYSVMGNPADLDRAMQMAEETVERIPTDSPDRAGCLNNLGIVLRARYMRMGQVADLERAVEAWKTAVERTPISSPDRAMFLSSLGNGLLDLYMRTGQVADLARAIKAHEESVERTPTDSPNRASRLNSLGGGLSLRHKQTGRIEDLDAAIKVWQDAVRRTPANSPSRAGFQNNLGTGLHDRYERTGDPVDLDSAIDSYMEAVRRTPADSTDRANHLINLGAGLRDRYGRTGQAADLDRAIEACEEAVDRTTPDSPDRSGCLNNLGNGLYVRYMRTGQVADLARAIKAHKEAVDLTMPDSPTRVARLNNFGNGLRALYTQTGDPSDLNAAIAAHEDALATLDRTLLDSPVTFVIGQQLRWTVLYVQAVETLLAAGRPADALAGAEGAKSRILAGLMSRGELQAPASIPAELAARERAAAERLRALDAVELVGRGRDDVTGDGRTRIADRAGVVDELRAAWDEMAALGPEAAEYVALRRGDRPTAAGLARLAGALLAGTALLSLFDTGERTLLFLLRGGTAEPVAVEAALDRDTLRYDYLANYEDEVLNRATLVRLGRPLTHRWRALGRPLLGPLLPHLDGIDHLVIAPEGVYHQLPLHALWIDGVDSDDAGDTLIDHCAVSYIPALGLLERLRRRARPDRSATDAPLEATKPADLSGLSVVLGYTDADPATEDGAREREVFLGEARAVAARLGVAPLLDGAATGEALEVATASPLRVLHLSCHGYFNPEDALESGVLLAGGRKGTVYTARRFMARRLAAELVTLSACQTAVSGSLGGDEMAGLSMALLSAGARSLLLGLWSVNAATTAVIMDDFYRRLGADGGAGNAAALRQTMLAMRRGALVAAKDWFDPADPYYWAPFVLVGDWR
jgi:tetratricopeptide (TPR) repeat protein